MSDSPPSKNESGVVLSVISLQSFFYAIMCSMLPPFFPVQAEKLGLSDFENGAVFSIFSATVLLSSLFFAHYARRVGKKRLLTAGIILECVSLTVFGLGSHLWQFLILRAIQGIGAGASNTASFALLADHFPVRFGFVSGLIQTIIGLGFMLGPPLGGWLYELGGFPAPFLGTGVTAFVCLLVAATFLPGDHSMLLVFDDSSNTKIVPPLSMLRIPSVAVTAGTVCIMSLAFSNIDASLSLYLKHELGLTPLHISVAFFAISLLYAISATIIGFTTDKLKQHKAFMAIGMVLLGGSTVFLGLWFSTEQYVWVLIAVGVFGIGGAACLIPSSPDMLNCAIKGVYGDGVVDVVSPVAGLHSSLYAMGQIMGPLLGAALNALLLSCGKMYLTMGLFIVGYAVIVIVPAAVAQYRKGHVSDATSLATPLVEERRVSISIIWK